MAGYTAGLVVAMIFGYVYHVAQPALLYLVPGTLVPLAAAAHASGDLRLLWAGWREDFGAPLPSAGGGNQRGGGGGGGAAKTSDAVAPVEGGSGAVGVGPPMSWDDEDDTRTHYRSARV